MIPARGADSCLRRSLEALFDIGRHILAKGYARGVTEYKEIAPTDEGVAALVQELIADHVFV